MLVDSKNRPINISRSTKRGDTIIEVMFAIAIFCLVAIISISLMNNGVSSAENSLEVVTVRNELNAQAEALRFIHSSYISELTLKECGDPSLAPNEECQEYKDLWNKIVDNAIKADEFADFDYPPNTCREIYTDDLSHSTLVKNKAFILNARNLSPSDVDSTYINASVGSNWELFTESPLNARILYTDTSSTGDSEELSETKDYNVVARAEGIWVIAVKDSENNADGKPRFYDFYIQTCWYGPNALHPTTLDTVIRLYNPAGA